MSFCLRLRMAARVLPLLVLAPLLLPGAANAAGLSKTDAATLDAALTAAMAPPQFTPPGPAIDPAP